MSYRNVALYKPASMSSMYPGDFPASRVTDGRFAGFCHTQSQKGAWVEVDLQGSFFVNSIRIVNRNDGQCEERLGRFKVILDNNTFGSYSFNQMSGRPPAMVIPVNTVCSRIRVQLKDVNYLHISQIEAFGVEAANRPQQSWGAAPVLVDLAYGKPASMSSEYSPQFPARNLVDGSMTTFCHTAIQPDPWATVDLGANYFIVNVEIFNRCDNQCLERLGNFRVLLDGVDSGTVYNYTQMYGHPPRIVIPVARYLRKITVQVIGQNYLHLTALRAVGFANY